MRKKQMNTASGHSRLAMHGPYFVMLAPFLILFIIFTILPIISSIAVSYTHLDVYKRQREYWGGMLSLGATTFWEDFDIAWLKDAAPIDRFPDEGEIDVHGTYGRYCYKGYRPVSYTHLDVYKRQERDELLG